MTRTNTTVHLIRFRDDQYLSIVSRLTIAQLLDGRGDGESISIPSLEFVYDQHSNFLAFEEWGVI